MNAAEHWREVDRVFEATLDRPPGERETFLDAVCAGDLVLRREVEKLLAADAREAIFLDRPADKVFGLKVGDCEGPQRLGPYRLLRPIGRGGMGTVYLAVRDDEQYERLVAIKILHSGLEDTELCHRFLAERQILARLDHPNIARLYDGGCTEDGRPYLVMELIVGLPIDEYCDHHQLTIDRRLELFRRVCAAVQHAHQNLLVHRDIKPANILVTPAGEPKLLDFGIAKQLEPAAEPDAHTHTGVRVMTLHYASPEQVKGEAITTASDVYSLGVLLYELLAGRSPYQVAEEAPSYEIERAIHEQEPEKPSMALELLEKPSPEAIAAARRSRPAALRRQLAGDLDTIVLMALRKEPMRRYESVARLAADVRRHQKNLPVSARPDTWGYQTQKLVLRHRTGAAAAAVGCLLIAGLLVSLFAQGRRAAQERDKARYALSFLVDTFKQADPYQTRGESLTAREILDEGANRVAWELADQPDVQAAVMDTIGEINRSLGRYEAAEPLLTRALELRREAAGAESLEVAESLGHLAALKGDLSDYAGAEELLRQSLALRKRLLGEDDLEVARTLNALGDLLLMRGAPPGDVDKLHQEALAIAREVEGPMGATVGSTLLHLARVRQRAADDAQAEKLFREGLEIEQRALGNQHPRYYRDLTSFGELLINAGKAGEAEAVLRQALEKQQKTLGAEHPDVAITLVNLAMAVYLQDRYAEAETLNRRVLALVHSRYGPTHFSVPMILGNLAAVLHSQKKISEAVPYLQEALELRRRDLGDEHPLVAQALLLLAGTHRDLEEYPEALRLAREAREILEKAEGSNHPHVAYAEREIGKIYMAQNRFAEAEPYLRRSLEIRLGKLEPENPEIVRAESLLAKCLIELGRSDEAETLARKAQEVAAHSPIF